MRESRTFAERTKVLKSDEVLKRYFLVYSEQRLKIVWTFKDVFEKGC